MVKGLNQRISKVRRVCNPQLHTTGNLRVGAVDVEERGTVGTQPDDLLDIAIIGESGGLARFEVDQAPPGALRMSVKRPLGGRE